MKLGGKQDPWGDSDFQFEFSGDNRNDMHAISMDGHVYGYWTEEAGPDQSDTDNLWITPKK
jgi:hypothetical protein